MRKWVARQIGTTCGIFSWCCAKKRPLRWIRPNIQERVIWRSTCPQPRCNYWKVLNNLTLKFGKYLLPVITALYRLQHKSHSLTNMLINISLYFYRKKV